MVNRGDVASTKVFLEGYEGSERPIAWLQKSLQQHLPSYRAMCYTLLHEQDLMQRIFEAHPELWRIASLANLQAQLWGFLDSHLGV